MKFFQEHNKIELYWSVLFPYFYFISDLHQKVMLL